MKLSDFVVDFLVQRGVTHFFGISGGAAVHLFDSVARHPLASYVCTQHEQAAAMAADGFARTSGRIGAAITTSGPGATNLLTGVCCSFYDSVPTFMLTGQVATFRLKGERQVRQIGFQETDVPSIFRSVTKYVARLEHAERIRFHMEKAYHLALDGRPGPVLLDLPDDLQRAEVHPEDMEGFVPAPVGDPDLESDIRQLTDLLRRAERPVLVLGGGCKTPAAPRAAVLDLVNSLGIPVLLTWAGLDLIPSDHALRVGTFGVYGPRAGNFTIQNADLIIAVGTRLSQNVTGGLLEAFAREASIVMVDVDAAEMSKFDGRGIDVTLRIQSRVSEFLNALRGHVATPATKTTSAWLDRTRRWREAFPLTGVHGPAVPGTSCVDAYSFVEALSRHLPDDETVVVDTGGNLTWTSNALRPKPKQTVFSAWNHTPMGYALPASIGAAFAAPGRGVTCVTGDGGLMLCLGELATVLHHRLPIRIMLFNNHGHGIQRQTIETWLEGRYEGVHPESGLAFPDFGEVARAMGFRVITIDNAATAEGRLAEAYSHPGPVFCNVEIYPDQKLYPVLKYGSPLEDQFPFLDSSVLNREMIVGRFRPDPHVDPRAGGAGV